jgi:carbamate kinase
VVALGGNALLRRGQAMTIANQRENVRVACSHLAPLAQQHELIISHGNGPQVGLLALEEAAYTDTPDAPLDVLGAETQGMIGYLIELELTNRLKAAKPLAALLTMIEIDPADPAFASPSKPIGPLYEPAEAEKLAADMGWVFKPDSGQMRRVVPSPAPKRIVQDQVIHWLLERGCVVICAGGGGIPTGRHDDVLEGVEAVVDKDHASALLAKDLRADILILATDTPAVYVGFGTPEQRAISQANPDAIEAEYREEFAAGSMLPKVTAGCNFARQSGRRAVIGALADIDEMVAGRAGTEISNEFAGVSFAARSA